MAGTSRLEGMYDFLCEREKSGVSFTVQELAKVSDYAKSTARTYLTKKLVGYLVWETENGNYVCDGVRSNYSKQEFLEYMSQTSRYVKMDETDRVMESLLERSSDAFLLALESYNRPSLQNRVQAFCVLMVDAWGLLLRAELVQSRGKEAIFPKDADGSAISVRGAAAQVFTGEAEAVCENIHQLIRLRDDAVHLLIPDLRAQLGELFQASVLNFRQRYERTAGRRLAALSPGLMTLAVDQGSVKPAVIERKYGPEAANRVQEFLDQFRRLRAKYGDNDRFAITTKQQPLVSKT